MIPPGPPTAAFPLTNTAAERLALTGVNLSDGHARVPLSPHEVDVWRRALADPDALRVADQFELERRFAEGFFHLAGQAAPREVPRLFSYSSSTAMKLVAEVLRDRHDRVLLIEPCFDSIRLIATAAGFDVAPLPEQGLPDLPASLGPTDVVWLVLPNNPTGFELGPEAFASVARQCATARATLVVDPCFRFFSDTMCAFDQYAVLNESGCSYVIIEETGKTWSLLDLKVGMTVSSPDWQTSLVAKHEELLLNVSPVVLHLLRAFVDDTRERGLDAVILAPASRNRQRVVAALGDVADVTTPPSVPLAHVGAGVDARAVWAAAQDRGVDVLPMRHYYWSASAVSNPGECRVRLPLMRPDRELDDALLVLRDVILALG